jgi:hypothetical protein
MSICQSNILSEPRSGCFAGKKIMVVSCKSVQSINFLWHSWKRHMWNYLLLKVEIVVRCGEPCHSHPAIPLLGELAKPAITNSSEKKNWSRPCLPKKPHCQCLNTTKIFRIGMSWTLTHGHYWPLCSHSYHSCWVTSNIPSSMFGSSFHPIARVSGLRHAVPRSRHASSYMAHSATFPRRKELEPTAFSAHVPFAVLTIDNRWQ